MSDINFSKLTWENLPARTTALSATNLNRIEKGIDDSVNGVNSNSHSIAELQTRISALANGSPTPAKTVAEMTEHDKVYLYTGSEPNYTAGNWYFWNGSAWTSGGTYGGAVTDKTLTLPNVPADSKAVGDVLAAKADADDLTAVQTAVAEKADTADVESLTEDITDLKDELTAKLQLSRAPNKWNENDKTIGFIAPNGSRNTTSTTYNTLINPIPVSEGDVVRFYGNNKFGSINARFICAYNANGDAVSSAGSSVDTRTYTVPSGIVAIIPSFLASVTNKTVTVNQEVTEYVPYEEPYYVATEDFLPKSMIAMLRNVIEIKTTDDESAVISKMVNAYNNGNCDVVFERGVYNFGTAIATVKTDYDLSGNNEIPIGNGCRYYFNGSTLNAVIDLGTLGHDYYCNLLGGQNIASDFELHDGILMATDTRYVVHDEAAGKEGAYNHLYSNMQLIYTTNNREEAIRKCVGGGTGRSGVVKMTGCKFVTDGTDSAVSFHGNAKDYAGAEFMLSVTNCWISNSLRAGKLSSNQKGTLFYAGNSSGSALQTYDRWDVTAFLNEVR